MPDFPQPSPGMQSPPGGAPQGQMPGQGPNPAGPLLNMILAFLAGNGFKDALGQAKKAMGMLTGAPPGGGQPNPANPNRPHQAGVQMKANPQQGMNSISPELLKRAQGDPQLAQQIIQMLLKQTAGGPQPTGGPAAGVPGQGMPGGQG